jgi:hypothetical protein
MLKKLLLVGLLLMLQHTYMVAQQIVDSLLVASLERTTCYGKCPYYKISVYSNGLVVYHGKKYVSSQGMYYTNISTKKVFQLLELAHKINYFDLANKYPTTGLGIIDFPTCITYVRTAKGTKTIYNRNEAPMNLVRYQDFFDSLFEEVEWKNPIVIPSK